MKRIKLPQHILLILIILLAGTVKLHSQCQITSTNPSSLTFIGNEGEVKYLTFDMSGGCGLSFGVPPYLEVVQTGNNQLRVALINRSSYPGALNASIILIGNGTMLRSIPVSIGAGTAAPLSGGTISIGTTTVAPNTSPGSFSNAASASGGSGGYSYQWQQSTNGGSSWTNITNATGTTYTCPALSLTTSFRRRVISNSVTAYSNTITITVSVALNPGTIGSSTTSVNYNTSPGILNNVTSPSGGNGSYTYQWQKLVNGSWFDIIGATSQTYGCPALTETTVFRRRVTSGPATAFSNVIGITVVIPTLTGGTIGTPNTTVNYNTSPGTFTNNALPSGGIGNYNYQWEQLPNGATTYTNISGATAATYVCPALTVNTSFRRKVTSGTATAYSNVITVNVTQPEVVNGTSTENYILSYSPQVEVKTESQLESQPIENLSATIQYFDGLGRPRQTISIAASPTKKDIVQPIVYDAFGREQYKYLPYAYSDVNNRGGIRPNPTAPDQPSEQKSFYTNTSNPGNGLVMDATPHARTVFESSPLNRVLQQGAPGGDWQPGNPDSDHTTRYSYETNVAGEVCLLYVDGDILKHGKTINGTFYGSYPANQLYKTVVKDENWSSAKVKLHTTEEFKDKQGQVVLKRSYVMQNNVITKVDTYYAYDDFGLLRYVLPPEASKQLNTAAATPENYTQTHSTVIKPWSYYYKYDSRKRMIEKQIPGAESVYMVYDKRDRLVLTQDGEQRLSKKWLFTKYDELNRPVLTGEVTYITVYSQPDLQQIVTNVYENNPARSYFVVRENTNTTHLGYSNTSYPNTDDGTITYLTATYYDNYGYPGQKAFDTANNISGYSDTDDNVNYNDRIKGQVTGSAVNILGTTSFLVTTVYYDHKYRAIQTRRQLYDGAANAGEETVSSLYDFVGKVKKTKQSQTFNGVVKKVEKTYSHDHAGRLLKVEQLIEGDTGNSTVTLAENTYNELGQLIDKKIHKNAALSNPLQSVDYKYNIRGWLTQVNNPDNLSNDGTGDVNSDLFAMRLLYNTNETNLNSSIVAQYNGNISAMVWNTSGGGKQGYAYTYDALNRLTGSDYKTYGTGWAESSNYEEKGFQYDLNGNILKLIRTGSTGAEIANYTYDYTNTGNKLNKINNLPAYVYNKNGSSTYDGMRGFTVTYNQLSLPSRVQKGAEYLDYVYSATGEKLAKKKNGTVVNYYQGSYIYKSDKSLDYILNEEGMVIYSSGTYIYQYYLKDHLGNTRAMFKKGTGTAPDLLQKTDYYAFGSLFIPVPLDNGNKYLYNGKELQDDKLSNTSLDWYDYGARMYDPELGRFHVIDRFAEKYYSMTPYQYGANNPILFIDINGDSIQAVHPDAQQMIINTLTTEDAAYVQFSENGMIDLDILNSHASESGNFNALQEIANSDLMVIVSLDDKYTYKDNDGKVDDHPMSYQEPNTLPPDIDGSTLNGTTTGEAGFMGKTLLPGKGRSGENSPDGRIRVIINKNLSNAARAEMYSHEANGHGLMYIRTRDRVAAGHQYSGATCTNQPLRKLIISSKMETVRNMKRK